MLQEYSKQKENLLGIYEMLEGKNSNFVDQNLKGELLEKKNSLRNDQFILAVAGQMKAGKSTLLNALIFGDDILPADDTELTAKITFITYGEEPCYEATLYSKSEFEDLRKSMRGTDSDEDFNKLLNDSLEILQNRGYSSYDELLSKKVIRGENLKELIDFVGKKGIFTPFVNTLTLKINSNWVKNIIVVDTPGMNSPNQLRDKVVKDWIVKADAVLYCSYAGRALDATDLKFVQDYMLHISSKHRLFAMTKADLITGEERLMNTIGELIDSDWNKNLDLIPSQDAVFPVCQMAVLLDKMDKSSVPFTPRMKEEYEMVEDRVDFEHCNKQFSKLESAIEKKLISNKDSNMIETHQQYLSTIFSEKLQELNEDMDSCKKSFELINSDKDELKKKEQQIINDIKSIGESFETIEKDIKIHFDKSFKNIKITAETNIAISSIKSKLGGMSLDDLDKEVAKTVEDKLGNCIEILKGQVTTFSNVFSSGLPRIFETYNLHFEYLNLNLIKARIELQCRNFINSEIRKLNYELGEASSSLKQNYSDNISGWRKFRDFFKSNQAVGKQRGADAFQKFLTESVDPITKKFSSAEKTFLTELNSSVSGIINHIEAENRKTLNEKQEEIRVLKNTEGEDIEVRKKITQTNYIAFESQKVELDIMISDIKNKINAAELWEMV